MFVWLSVEYQPRVVQFLSPVFLGNMVLAAGPAQFGVDLTDKDGVSRKSIESPAVSWSI